jgi:sugar/nucleoside kinase (ribokinase family)
MLTLSNIEPVDYLVIGHITQDVTPSGLILGGTASYAALTARAFGLRVGIVTACAPDFFPSELDGIHIVRKSSAHTSTFENVHTPQGRIQHVRHVASKLSIEDVPTAWRSAPIVHLGPLAGEIDNDIVQGFPQSLTVGTVQGWLRGWDGNGLVSYRDWQTADQVLPHLDAAVLSIEDVRGSEESIATFVSLIPILVVTEGANGARVYWNSDVRYFRPPLETEVDPVGAGDVFATSFFIRLQASRDPWEAARVATLAAANSVTRPGIKGVPTQMEVQKFLTEIIEYPVK